MMGKIELVLLLSLFVAIAQEVAAQGVRIPPRDPYAYDAYLFAASQTRGGVAVVPLEAFGSFFVAASRRYTLYSVGFRARFGLVERTCKADVRWPIVGVRTVRFVAPFCF